MNTPEDMAALGASGEKAAMTDDRERNPGVRSVPVTKVTRDGIVERGDCLAVEEPLEIRLGFTEFKAPKALSSAEEAGKRVHRSLSITMRTPGDDLDLAVGFLFTEGIVKGRSEIAHVAPCGRPVGDPPVCNTVRVDLAAGCVVDMARLSRHFYTSSSCGVCGKSSLAALKTQLPYSLAPARPVVEAGVIYGLPDKLRQAQEIFEHTGGLHACALFTPAGELLDLCEDVGRHNALDKLIGRQFMAGELPLLEKVLLLSGRASYELIQKALMAGIPIIAAVGAPSSLAAELASANGATLLGFVRNDRFNIYAGGERIGLR
jgi:FdhD protein